MLIPSSTEYLSTESVHRITGTLIILQREKAWRGALLGVQPAFFHDRIAKALDARIVLRLVPQ